MANSEALLSFLKSSLRTLAPIPDEQWSLLISEIRWMEAKPGQYLVHQGEPARELYFVGKGLLKSAYTNDTGKEVTKNFLWEGRIAGPYVSMLTRQPATFSILAMEESRIAVMSAETLPKMFSRHCCWQELGRRIAENLLIEREFREFQLLVYDAARRYEVFLKEYAPVVDRIPLYEIASFLGVTPVALSGIRKKRVGSSK